LVNSLFYGLLPLLGGQLAGDKVFKVRALIINNLNL